LIVAHTNMFISQLMKKFAYFTTEMPTEVRLVVRRPITARTSAMFSKIFFCDSLVLYFVNKLKLWLLEYLLWLINAHIHAPMWHVPHITCHTTIHTIVVSSIDILFCICTVRTCCENGRGVWGKLNHTIVGYLLPHVFVSTILVGRQQKFVYRYAQ